MRICGECISNKNDICTCDKSIYHNVIVGYYDSSCNAFLSGRDVYEESCKSRKKKWHKVKSMDDMETPNYRL